MDRLGCGDPMEYRGYRIDVEEGVRPDGAGSTNSAGAADGVAGARGASSAGSAVPRVVVHGVEDFDLRQIFECGQCFRWVREQDGSYSGVVREKVINAAFQAGDLILDNVTFEEFDRIWYDYFDLGRDYGAVKKAVAVDDIMREAVAFGGGIRLLRQETWETMISFIISANNNIPRITRIINDLSRLYGRELEYRGRKYYSFPGAGRLASCSLEQLQVCRAGYRCGYIRETAGAVASGGFDMDGLARMGTEEARKALLGLKGVGGKVADCILLFSGIGLDVFPTDVWVKRVMEELYFKREAGLNEIRRFALDYFGQYAGIAQQYLFYYAREHKIGA